MRNDLTSAEQNAASGRRSSPTSLLSPRIGLSFFAFILIGANNSALGVVLPSMRTHYVVDKGTVSFVFLLSTVGYLITAISSGVLVHRLGTRMFLVLGAATFMLGSAMISLAPSFAMLLAGMLCMGFGMGIIDAGLNAYFAGLPNNSALLNYLHAFYGVGALAGPIVASTFLGIGWGWNSLFILWIGLSLMVLMGFAGLFTEHKKPGSVGQEQQKGNVLAAALRMPVVWLAAFFLLFYVGAEVSVGTWSYSLLTEERHEPEVLSGWVISGFWMGLTLGRVLLGTAAQRLGNARLIQMCIGGVGVGVILVWVAPNMLMSAAGLWIAGFSMGPIFPTTVALTSQLVPARLLPSAIGFLGSLGSMGAALFPWIAGNLTEWAGLWTLLPYVIVLTAVMLVLWLFLQSNGRKALLETGAV